MTGRRINALRWLAGLTGAAMVVAGVRLAAAVLRLAIVKRFSVDEYEYAHGAWLVSRGEVIYRDFFEAHFPLIHQLMALPWLALDDEPTNILALRLAMLPVLGLALWAGWTINRRVGLWEAWATPLVTLATVSLVSMSIEIRPDPLAWALFLAAVAVLHLDRPGLHLGPRTRAALAGALTMAAVWGSQKVLYYGAVMAAAFIADLVADWRGTGRPLLGDWRAFLGGALAVVAAIAIYLTVTGSWDDWIEWALVWVAGHQIHYPGFPWVKNFLPFMSYHVWLFAFGLVGVARAVGRVRQRMEDHGLDLLLLALLITTFASAAWQTAPYLYSFVPFAGTLAIFAARGIVGSFRYLAALSSNRPQVAAFAIPAVALLLVGEAAHVKTLYAADQANDNRAQLATLKRLGEITAPEDPVFDISAQRISRPGVHFFFFTDAVIRSQEAERLATEMPAAIVEKGATVYLHDPRFPSLPERLREFVLESYLPMDEVIWIWGRRWKVGVGSGTAGPPSEAEVPQAGATVGDGPAEAPRGLLDAAFPAIRAGEYFVWPEEALAQGVLTLDGQPITSPVVRLDRGNYRVRYEGSAEEVAILWLPRDGRRWVPADRVLPQAGTAR